MKTVRIALIGLGCRGLGLLTGILLPLGTEENGKKYQVNAVCDVYEDRTEAGVKAVFDATGVRPFATTDYRETLTREDIDAVVIACSWEDHIRVAIDAMKAGKAAAMEVGGAYRLSDCFDLVRTQEETGTPFMFLENCCYGQRELTVTRMARAGKLGRIVHCAGGYQHDLRQEISYGKENRHYRLRNYLSRNCENYPTHELGPIAKLLDINNGNRLVSLTSTASLSAGLHEYILDRKPEDKELAEAEFAQGDIVTTVIRCARGETITLTLDTTLPRFYSRAFTVRGTKGSYFEDMDAFFFDREHEKYEWNPAGLRGNAGQYEKDWLHPLWGENKPQGSHGGMDWLVFSAFAEALIGGYRMPIDVYDAAAWMAVSALSEESIRNGSKPVEIPDFTGGKWEHRTDLPDFLYSLDRLPEKK